MSKKLLSLLAAIAIAAGMAITRSTMQSVRQQDPAIARRQIVVAAVDIRPGQKLAPEMLRLDLWAEDKVPQGSFARIDDLAGRVAATNIVAKEAVLASKLYSPEQLSRLPMAIPPGMRALTLPVDDSSARGGFLAAGNRVDVVYLDKEGRGSVLVQEAYILDAQIEGGPFGENSAGKSKVESITLLLDRDDAERLALAHSVGTIRFLVRGEGDYGKLEPNEPLDKQALIAGGRPKARRRFANSERPAQASSLQAQPPPEPRPEAIPAGSKIEAIEGGKIASVRFFPD